MTDLATVRRIVARHIWASITAPTAGLTLTDQHEIIGASQAATRLQAALDAAGIDLTAELDQLAASNLPAELRVR